MIGVDEGCGCAGIHSFEKDRQQQVLRLCSSMCLQSRSLCTTLACYACSLCWHSIVLVMPPSAQDAYLVRACVPARF